MTIFASAYDTTVTQGYPVSKIHDDILAQYIRRQLSLVEKDIFAVVQGNVTPFSMPFMVKDKDSTFIAIDARPMVKGSLFSDDISDMEIRASHRAEFNTLITQAKLESIWHSSSYRALANIHPSMMTIYARWITSGLVRRFGLDAREMSVIEVLSCLYYISLSQHERDWDEYFTTNALLTITQTIKIPSQFVKETILDINTPLTDIKSLIDIIKVKCDNVKLDALTPALLITHLASTWFGNNKGETLAVAIEHPPTFISLVYAAISETMFRKLGFTQVVQSVLKGDQVKVQTKIKTLLDDTY